MHFANRIMNIMRELECGLEVKCNDLFLDFEDQSGRSIGLALRPDS